MSDREQVNIHDKLFYHRSVPLNKNRSRQRIRLFPNAVNNFKPSVNVVFNHKHKRLLQVKHVELVAQFLRCLSDHRDKRSTSEVVSGLQFQPFTKAVTQSVNHLSKGPNELNIQSVPWQLPNDLLFCFEPSLKIPLMIDTGASRSLVPKRFLKKWDEASEVELQGLVDKTKTLGSITIKLNLNLPFNPPLELLVVDDLLDFCLIGMDFLQCRGISIQTNPGYLSQTYKDKVFKILLFKGAEALPPLEWENKQ